MNSSPRQLIIDVIGTVQGVGFRPHLYRFAKELNLTGTIQNRGHSVRFILEGTKDKLHSFSTGMVKRSPKNARIHRQKTKWGDPVGHIQLKIIESDYHHQVKGSLPLDLATCEKCMEEFLSPTNRRFGYPFISCTDCGPKYSIMDKMPFDRIRTSLKSFPLCDSCQQEYSNPSDRRFHAQGINCGQCGPMLFLKDRIGNNVYSSGDGKSTLKMSHRISDLLCNGNLLALRGIGGFQLVLNARNKSAILKLRKLKQRPSQAFAIMARDASILQQICAPNHAQLNLLQSGVAPILILSIKSNCDLPLKLISPDTHCVGIMLPTTPIHKMLFGYASSKIDFLVVTSGNLHGHPICLSNEDAYSNFSELADYHLTHNRDISSRVDDSVYADNAHGTQVWRIGRGLAPLVLKSEPQTPKKILALGGELKNTISIQQDGETIVSPHIGNLYNSNVAKSQKDHVKKIIRLYGFYPEVIVTDKHPQYFATQLGESMASELDIPLLQVQHHHAHGLSCMFEHKLREALAVVYDGTGLGDDGSIWGGEIFHIKDASCTRLGSLSPVPLPGGDKSTLEPWRQVLGRVYQVEQFVDFDRLLDLLKIPRKTSQTIIHILQRQINCAQTSSAGRLFDATASLLGLVNGQVSYEGEAAIKLQKLAEQASPGNMHYDLDFKESNSLFQLQQDSLFIQLIKDVLIGTNKREIALKFHNTLALGICQSVKHLSILTGQTNVVFSGGVFQNRLLCRLILKKMNQTNIKTFWHSQIPPNDGGISIGQIQYANLKSF